MILPNPSIKRDALKRAPYLRRWAAKPWKEIGSDSKYTNLNYFESDPISSYFFLRARLIEQQQQHIAASLS